MLAIEEDPCLTIIEGGATYSGSNYDEIWMSICAMCDLFHDLALQVAEHFGFTYRQTEEDGIREYLKMVKENEC